MDKAKAKDKDNEEKQSFAAQQNVPRSSGIYLILCDELDCYENLLPFVARLSHRNGGHVGIVHVSNISEHQHWNTIEAQLREELRAKAEQEVYQVSKKLAEYDESPVVYYFCEGDIKDQIQKTIEENEAIVGLFLSSSSASKKQRDLVSYFSSKGSDQLRVPLIAIPENFEFERMERIL